MPARSGPQNEDNLLAIDGIYVVADGMGGHEAGEVASQIAVDRVRRPCRRGRTAKGPERSSSSISNANGDIFRAAIANPWPSRHGHDVTAIAVIGDQLAGRGAPTSMSMTTRRDPRGPLVPRAV